MEWSRMLYCLTALTTPIRMATIAARIVAGTTILSVTRRRVPSWEATSWPVVLVPKLPCSMPVSQVQYRSSNGWSRCSWCRAASIVAGEMCGFAFKVASGSPDTATRRNTRKLATSKVTSPARQRRRMYPPIATSGPSQGRPDFRQPAPPPARAGPEARRGTGSCGLHPPDLGVPRDAEVGGVGDDVAVAIRPGVQLRRLEQRQGGHVLPQDRVDLVPQVRRLGRVGAGRRLVHQAVHLLVRVVVPVLPALRGVGVGAVDGHVPRGERRRHPRELGDVELALEEDGAEQRVGAVVLDVDLDADGLHVGLEQLLDLGPDRVAAGGRDGQRQVLALFRPEVRVEVAV